MAGDLNEVKMKWDCIQFDWRRHVTVVDCAQHRHASIFRLDGKPVASLPPSADSLGIRSAATQPGQFAHLVAIATFDHKIIFLDAVSGQVAWSIDLPLHKLCATFPAQKSSGLAAGQSPATSLSHDEDPIQESEEASEFPKCFIELLEPDAEGSGAVASASGTTKAGVTSGPQLSAGSDDSDDDVGVSLRSVKTPRGVTTAKKRPFMQGKIPVDGSQPLKAARTLM